MDPTTALFNLVDLLHQGEFKEAAETAENLQHWMNGGGFLPICEPSQWNALVHGLCYATRCAGVLQRVRDTTEVTP